MSLYFQELFEMDQGEKRSRSRSYGEYFQRRGMKNKLKKISGNYERKWY